MVNRTSLMGVINITPDSFSDGGECLQPELALKRASEQISQGADVLDLGAQSTRPGAKEVGCHEELRRLIPAIQLIRQHHPKSTISVDTFLSEVAEAALDAGANWINDVSGGRRDQRMLRLIAEKKCRYVLMHSRGNSRSMEQLTDYSNVVTDVRDSLLKATEKALKAGLSTSQLIWDPGLGFAKNNFQNLLLLQNLEAICAENFPVLVGPSRKRFIGSVLDQPLANSRLMGTAAVVCRCVQAGVQMVRVHDVAAIKQTIRMASELWP